MPQLETSTFASQLFWLCITFFSMLFIMSKFIVPRIAEILNQRQRKIDDYLHKSYQIRQQAEESLDKYHRALNDATAKANESLAKTKEELNELINREQTTLNSKLQKKIAKGEAEIAKSKEEALAQVKEMTQDLAKVVVAKIGLDINSKDIQTAIKKVSND